MGVPPRLVTGGRFQQSETQLEPTALIMISDTGAGGVPPVSCPTSAVPERLLAAAAAAAAACLASGVMTRVREVSAASWRGPP